MDMKRFREIQAENAAVCEKKNKAYGDKNITRFGALGLVVRMTDKMERLINVVMNDPSLAGDELAKETAADMANYAVMLQMVEDGTFEGVKDGGQ
jgi:hypothetical protein